MLRHILIAVFSCLLVFLCYLYVSYTYVPQSTFSVQQMHTRLKNRTVFQTAYLLAQRDSLFETYNDLLAQYHEQLLQEELTNNNKSGSIFPGYSVEIESSKDESSSNESSNNESSLSFDPSFVEQDGTLIRTSYFEFTIPESWIDKVELVPFLNGSGYHLNYVLGISPEGEQNGYYQPIFDIILYTDPVDLDNAYSMHDRFDILGVADGTSFVLTQRTDSALEFYSPNQWDQIKYMLSGTEFDVIEDSFVLY